MQRAEGVNRGVDETPEQRETIISLVEQLEKRNPTKRCVYTGETCERLESQWIV